MQNRIEDISKYLGTVLFIALFFLVITVFSKSSAEQSKGPVHDELLSEWHSKSSQAISTENFQFPLFRKNKVSFVDQKNIPQFNTSFKRSADNRKIAQRIISINQTELVIKPFAMSRFYYHLFPIVKEEVPILS